MLVGTENATSDMIFFYFREWMGLMRVTNDDNILICPQGKTYHRLIICTSSLHKLPAVT